MRITFDTNRKKDRNTGNLYADDDEFDNDETTIILSLRSLVGWLVGWFARY